MQGGEQNGLFLALKQDNVATLGQRRDVTERVEANVATFGATSRRSGQRRDVTESGIKQHRDVEYQRRDVIETHKNPRRDVDYSRRDVPEGIKIDVATLGIHIATLQRQLKSTSCHWESTS